MSVFRITFDQSWICSTNGGVGSKPSSDTMSCSVTFSIYNTQVPSIITHKTTDAHCHTS